MEEPTVSVIVPCYNVQGFVKETVDRLMLQSYKHLQVILVDDGSTDNTYQILCELKAAYNNIELIKSKNAGLSSARNKGIQAAKGKYIQFLDADDMLHNQKIEAHVKFLEQHPSIDLVYSDTLFFDHNHPEIFYKNIHLTQQQWMPMISGNGKEVLPHLVKGNIFTVCSPLVRYALFEKNIGFNTNFFALEDYEFWLRCAINGATFQYDNNSMAISYVRVHPKSMSKNLTLMYTHASMIRLYINSHLPEFKLRLINGLYNLKMNIAIIKKGYAKQPFSFLIAIIFNILMFKNTYYHISNE
ncbi:MAG: glycosyltransferase family 2 protein [Bacteroidia bacterium]|jgi:glycosyltransferase involved in cell wall biosynthesis|nr:glycosyltransferase family 2 protein [Bacteroidia bacterium]